MSKILKNTTGSGISIEDTGITIPASPGQYTIPPQDYLLWSASNNVITYDIFLLSYRTEDKDQLIFGPQI